MLSTFWTHQSSGPHSGSNHSEGLVLRPCIFSMKFVLRLRPCISSPRPWTNMVIVVCLIVIRGAPKEILGKSWEFGPRRGVGSSRLGQIPNFYRKFVLEAPLMCVSELGKNQRPKKSNVFKVFGLKQIFLQFLDFLAIVSNVCIRAWVIRGRNWAENPWDLPPTASLSQSCLHMSPRYAVDTKTNTISIPRIWY